MRIGYFRTILIGALVLAGVIACARTPERLVEPAIARAERTIAEADAGNTATFAPVELRTARTKLSKAKAAQRVGDTALSSRLAQQATLDAQLAMANARALAAERHAQQLRDQDRASSEQPARLSRNP